GVDLYFQQAEFPERRIDLSLHRVMADGFPSTRPPRGHTGTAHPVAADAAADGSTLTPQPALDQGRIFLFDLSSGKLGGQPTMRFVTLGHHDQTASRLVKA